MKRTSLPIAALLLALAATGCGSRANNTPTGLKEHGPGSHTTAIADKDGGACKRFSSEAVVKAFDAASAKPTAPAITPGDNRCTWTLKRTPYGQTAILVVEMHEARRIDFGALRRHTKHAATETGLGDGAFYSPLDHTLTVYVDSHLEQLELLPAPGSNSEAKGTPKRIRKALRAVAST